MTGKQTLDDLRTAAIKIVTSAARLRTANGDQYDVAELIANIVSSAAANLGGPEVLLARRPGSWEADYLRQLIEGTIGYDPLDWHKYRTEPIRVTLNVAELFELSDLHPGLLGFDAAADAICNEVWSELGQGPASDSRVDELLEHLERRYTEAYRAYGDRFDETVRLVAEGMKLPMIEVELDVDPQSSWWDELAVHNPDPWDDPVVDELWQLAHSAVALQNVDVKAVRDAGSVENDLEQGSR